jgi:hypothetical protein
MPALIKGVTVAPGGAGATGTGVLLPSFVTQILDRRLNSLDQCAALTKKKGLVTNDYHLSPTPLIALS